jgi:probable phosphomutase (TIGR03848 family)
VTLVLLARHGRTTANTSGVLAGRAPGTALDKTGVAQAERLAARLHGLRLNAIVTSPLQRCLQTLEPVQLDRPRTPVELDDRLAEVDYGDWTGKKLSVLARRKLWPVVQNHPSAAVFPGGESLAAMQARAVAAVREIARDRPKGVVLVCSHGDVIKGIVADALGLHLDHFQRIVVDPGSVSVIAYTEMRPMVMRLNDTSGDLSVFGKGPRHRVAQVGGGAGAEQP